MNPSASIDTSGTSRHGVPVAARAHWVVPLACVVPGLSMPAQVVALGAGCAALVALISASAPAVRAARLNIVAALAGR